MRCVYCGCETGTPRSHTWDSACRNALRALLVDVLMAADASWEDWNAGNDWTEVCQEVRAVLKVAVHSA